MSNWGIKNGRPSLIIFFVILGTSFWILYDATKIGARKGLVKGIGDMGPWGWFFSNLLLFIIAFPIYLYYRKKIKAAVIGASQKMGDLTDADLTKIYIFEGKFIQNNSFHPISPKDGEYAGGIGTLDDWIMDNDGHWKSKGIKTLRVRDMKTGRVLYERDL